MEEIRVQYERYAALFGKRVRVTVNRPMGAPPRYAPVNCGYLTDKLSSEVPEPMHYVYVLGVETPLRRFSGRIVAVIHREYGNAASDVPSNKDIPLCKSDRLVIVPDGVEIYEPDIRRAVSFAEREGQYHLYCMYEKSCGAVVYTMREGEPFYLLVRNRSGHIGFPKGHVEYGEDERATMKREIAEETSLSVEPDLRFREEYRYVLWSAVRKTAVYSIAYFTDGATVTTMENEIFGDWLVPFPEARQLLSYENDRQILTRADLYLRKRLRTQARTR